MKLKDDPMEYFATIGNLSISATDSDVRDKLDALIQIEFKLDGKDSLACSALTTTQLGELISLLTELKSQLENFNGQTF